MSPVSYTLICPRCKENKQPLMRESDFFVCSRCGAKYEYKNGYCNLYIDDKEVLIGVKAADPKRTFVTEMALKKWASRRSVKLGKLLLLVFGLFGWGWVLLLPFALKAHCTFYWALFASSLAVSAVIAYEYYLQRLVDFQKEADALWDLYSRSAVSEYDVRQEVEDEENVQTAAQQNSVREKAEWVERFVSKYADKQQGMSVLVMGSGGKLHQAAVSPYMARNAQLTGVDIYGKYIREFAEISGNEAFMANCMSIPFADGQFDIVNMTDILEHLHAPLMGLLEASRVLKSGGMLVITTPNRHSICTAVLANPILLVLHMLSFKVDRFLSKPAITTNWMGHITYHTEFSEPELRTLFRKSSFDICEMLTYKYSVRPVEAICQRLPLFRKLGEEWFVILQKK